MHAVLTWEVSRREQSPGLNALLSMVAREQKNQLGEHLFVHQKAKKEAEAAEQGLPPWAVSGPGAAAPARWGGGAGHSSPVVPQSHLSLSSIPEPRI